MRAFDQLTIERIEELQADAKAKGLEVDWEAGKLIPRKYAEMSPHQRATLAEIEDRKQRRRDVIRDEEEPDRE